MAFSPSDPLDIASIEGDGKQTAFNKIKNEITYIFSVFSGLFSPNTGHKHTGATNDAPKIGATGIEDGAIETDHFAADAECPKATLATNATNATNATTATTAGAVPWSGITGKPTLATIPLDYVIEQLLGTNGYTKWNSGKIEQWGVGSTETAIVFPTPFLIACTNIQVTQIDDSSRSQNNAATLPTLTGFMPKNQGFAMAIYWTAIGK